MNKTWCSILKATIVTWNRIKMSQTICNEYLHYVMQWKHYKMTNVKKKKRRRIKQKYEYL